MTLYFRVLSPLALTIMAVAAFSISALAAESVQGKWIVSNGKAVVTIAPCGRNMCGKISKILAPTPDGPPYDTRNSDPKLRKRPIMGLPVLLNLSDKGDSWQGKVYDPERGKTFRAEVRRKSASQLEVKGCWGMFCKTQIWKKAG